MEVIRLVPVVNAVHVAVGMRASRLPRPGFKVIGGHLVDEDLKVGLPRIRTDTPLVVVDHHRSLSAGDLRAGKREVVSGDHVVFVVAGVATVERVEPMEDLPVVMHAIVVGVGTARIHRGVERGSVQRLSSAAQRRDEVERDAGYDLCGGIPRCRLEAVIELCGREQAFQGTSRVNYARAPRRLGRVE